MSPGGSAKNCADLEEARKICEKDGDQLPNLLRRRSERNSVRVDCLRVVDGRNLLIFGVIDRWMFRFNSTRIPPGMLPGFTASILAFLSWSRLGDLQSGRKGLVLRKLRFF
jgi:hypothetical protein